MMTKMTQEIAELAKSGGDGGAAKTNRLQDAGRRFPLFCSFESREEKKMSGKMFYIFSFFGGVYSIFSFFGGVYQMLFIFWRGPPDFFFSVKSRMVWKSTPYRMGI